LPPSSGQKEASQGYKTTVRVIRDQGVKKNGEVTADCRIFEIHIEEFHDMCSFPNVIVSVMAQRSKR
jgi:hypothetical protein